jgi:phosphatidate cytidylyltransferase
VSASTREHVGLAASVAAETGEEDEVQPVAASMPGVESGVVGFEDVVDSAETEEAEAARQVDQRDLAVRVLTGVALATLFLGAVVWGPWALGLLLVLVMLIALSEFYGVLLRNGHQPLAIFGIIGGFIALVGTAVSGAVAIPGALIITSIVMFFFYALEPERTAPLTNSSLTLMGMAWVTGFSAFAMTILDAPDFRALVLAVVALTVFMDTASYFSGRSWGRRKLAPELSPNKTVEGLIGGVVVVLLTGAVIGTVEPFDLQAGLALAAVVAVVAPLGDLAMSVFKRTLGVKDMGVILPGHGGILDRIDALLFVIPAAWATFHALGYLV